MSTFKIKGKTKFVGECVEILKPCIGERKHKIIMTPMGNNMAVTKLRAAVFTIAKKWKQLKMSIIR